MVSFELQFHLGPFVKAEDPREGNFAQPQQRYRGAHLRGKLDNSCYFLITGLMEAKGWLGLFRTTGFGLVGLIGAGAGWGFGKLDNSCFSLLTGGLDGADALV